MTFEIEHRHNLSYEEFAKEYLYTNTPVVITDALQQWKAISRWTPEFFKKEFGSMTFTIADGEKKQSGYKENATSQYTMARFIDRVLESTEDNPAPYFRNRIL